MKVGFSTPVLYFSVCSCSQTALTPVTLAVTLCPARRPAGVTVTAINGTNLEQAEGPAGTKGSLSQMASEEGATCRARRPTAASTPALMAPHTTPTRTPTTAAPPPSWLPAEAGTAGSGRRPRGTAPLKEAAACWRGRLLLRSPRVLQERGAWRGRDEPRPLICWSETAAPTV